MPKTSAGILIYRKRDKGIEVFLVHPGGPFWRNKDEGAWSIPKGEYSEGDPLAEAKREFKEETSIDAPAGEYIELSAVKLKGGKIISAWAVEGDMDPAAIQSSTFELEWPPRSGRKQEFPEVDRAGWFSLEQAKHKVNIGQIPLLDELAKRITFR